MTNSFNNFVNRINANSLINFMLNKNWFDIWPQARSYCSHSACHALNLCSTSIMANITY